MNIKYLVIRTAVMLGLPFLAILLFQVYENKLYGYSVIIFYLLLNWRNLKFSSYRYGRILTAIAILFSNLPSANDWSSTVQWILPCFILVALIYVEPVIFKAINGSFMKFRNMNVERGVSYRIISSKNVSFSNAFLLVYYLSFSIFGVESSIVNFIYLFVAIVQIYIIISIYVKRRKSRYNLDDQVIREVVSYEPDFVLYFSAPATAGYHVTMWLPYLIKTNLKFIIVVKEAHHLRSLKSIKGVPIIHARTMADIESLIVPSVKAAFYVNNGVKNGFLVRLTKIIHVQLLHGDSDKASSFNPMTQVYNKIFVAGQAAINRYAANGVNISSERFEIVGRPQVSGINIDKEHIGNKNKLVALYAPTWAGNASDTNYCSLSIGVKIIQHLLDLNVTVIFRPHPYTTRIKETASLMSKCCQILAEDSKVTGRAHIWGKNSADMALNDCFNKADFMISDVSGVATDWLYSEKPFAITDMLNEGENFKTSFPLSKASYVIACDGSNLKVILNRMITADDLHSSRVETKRFYLGDFVNESYEDNFIEAVKKVCS